MSVFQTFMNLGKINTYRKTLKLTVPVCYCAFIRKSSDVPKKLMSFDEVFERRRSEAKRSIVVQVNSEKSFSELNGYCSKYASIKGMHHYRNSAEEHFILIEFTTEDNLKDVIKACSSHQKDVDVMALQSPFLWFRAAPDKKHKHTPPEGLKLDTENGDMVVDEDALYESLLNCNTVSEQIQILYDRTALNDLGIRLRYIVARQFENLFESLYSNIVVRPFGSTVNGFGKLGCDLDLVLTNEVTEEMSDMSKRLVFMEKRCSGGLRPWGRHLELVGAALELRAAGAARVARVPHARVPIAQCSHRYADLDVDLCYNNMSGVYMSELMWTLGQLDARVRPLCVAVRRWAHTVGLTNPHPGRWITNFPLSLLVLHFLQQGTQDGCLLPPLNTLIQHTGKDEDNMSCRVVPGRPPPPAAAAQAQSRDLETCLREFFEYYAQFDFQEKAISLSDGAAIRKPNSQPLYIVNPLEPKLNVSKNVSHDECERLKAEVRNAAWQLEAQGGSARGAAARGAGAWGALALLERSPARGLQRLVSAGNAQRLVSVKDLFKDEDVPQETEGVKDKLQRLMQKSDKSIEKTIKEIKSQLSSKDKKEPLKFKNTQVASEIFRIRRNKIV